MNPSDSLSISATIRARTFFARSPSSFRWRVISWPGKSFSWMRMTPPLRLTSRVWALWRTATPELENHQASTCSCRLTRSLCRMPSAIMGLIDTWDYRIRLSREEIAVTGRVGCFVVPTNIGTGAEMARYPYEAFQLEMVPDSQFLGETYR